MLAPWTGGVNQKRVSDDDAQEGEALVARMDGAAELR